MEAESHNWHCEMNQTFSVFRMYGFGVMPDNISNTQSTHIDSKRSIDFESATN